VSPPDVEVRLYEAALALRKEHYKDLMERWRAIETKAQGTIATTGILIAANLAFIRELESNASTLERVLLALLLAASILALGLAVAALRVRTVSEAPFAVSIEPLIMDFVRAPQLDEEAWRDVVREQGKVWGSTNANLHQANDFKARRVAFGQAALAVAALLAVVFCLMRIFDPSTASIPS
jgi:multisubunit Na+/H+ antiporter MnhG subunit